MPRTLPLIALLVTGIAEPHRPEVTPQWKENGYIGSCAGRACLGRRTECSIYSFPTPDGGRNTFFCYQD